MLLPFVPVTFTFTCFQWPIFVSFRQLSVVINSSTPDLRVVVTEKRIPECQLLTI